MHAYTNARSPVCRSLCLSGDHIILCRLGLHEELVRHASRSYRSRIVCAYVPKIQPVRRNRLPIVLPSSPHQSIAAASFLRRPLLPQCRPSATVTSAVRSAKAFTAARIRRVSSPAQAKAAKAKCASTAFRRASSRAIAPTARLVHTVNAWCLGTRMLSSLSTGTGPPCKTGSPFWTLRCAT